MKATVHYWCASRSKDAPYVPQDIWLTVFLPFIPHVGMDLTLTQNGDYHTVKAVEWSVNAPDELTVYLKKPHPADLEDWEFMESEGWKLT